MADPDPDQAERVARRRLMAQLVRDEHIEGLHHLRRRLAEEDVDADDETLRTDARRLGITRVREDGSARLVLGQRGGQRSGAGGGRSAVVAAIRRDPDWPLQLVVVAVVALFLLVGFLGWLLGRSQEVSPVPQPAVTSAPSTTVP